MSNYSNGDETLAVRRGERALTMATFLVALLVTSGADAADLYWDGNGTGSAGAGTAPGGSWGDDSFWNTSSTGSGGALRTATLSTDDVFFSAGTDATGTFAVSIRNNAAVSANSITIQEGNVTLDKGTASGSIINTGAGGLQSTVAPS